MATPTVSRTMKHIPRLALIAKHSSERCCRSLPSTPVLTRHLADSNNSRILSQSSLLLQDGIEFRELPVVMRRLAASDFPFTSSIYSGDSLRKMTPQEETFNLQLADCATLPRLFQLLEVPGDNVTAYTASFALDRLCRLQAARAPDSDSFLRKAVFNELCDTATRDIEQLENETVISLVRCYLRSLHYNDVYKLRINDEVERRVGDGLFTVSQLCTLIQYLSENIEGDSTIVNNIFIHLGARYKDVDHTNISQVYSVLRYVTPSLRYLPRLFEKQVCSSCQRLDPSDVVTVIKALTSLNQEHPQTMKAIGKWLLNNKFRVSKEQFSEILTAYIHFDVPSTDVLQSLERYLPERIDTLDKTLVAMSMEYCRKFRFLSPKILETVASDFVMNHKRYDVHELFYALRGFGCLNYLPPNSTQLFLTIDKVLSDKFSDFLPHHMVELLASFAYIKRIPANFLNKVFSPYFITKIKSLPEPGIRNAARRFLAHLYTAVLIEMPGAMDKLYVDKQLFASAKCLLLGRDFLFHQTLGKSLMACVEPRHVKQARVMHTYFVDYILAVDESGRFTAPVRYNPRLQKVAIVTLLPEHVCVDTLHPLGPHAMRSHHLRQLGYTVLEVHYNEFMLSKSTDGQRQIYLSRLLNKLQERLCKTS